MSTSSSAWPAAGADHPPHFRGVFRADLMARAMYAEGAGIARALPLAVAVPADVEDAALLVAWAKRTGTPLIPRGSGSGMAAGAVGPGVIVDLSRFTQIGAVDRETRRIRAGAGAVRGAIDAAARQVGLRFPVDPSSGAFCTIGGMVATNAAGARSLRFGATRPWVHGVHVVFDDGSTAWIRRDAPPPVAIPAVRRLVEAVSQVAARVDPAQLFHVGVRKESSGYGVHAMCAADGHLVDLLVGSEGTLGLFVEVELSLLPVASHTATVLATFPSLEAATASALAARDAGATACELLDRTFLDIAASDGPTGIAADAEAVLIAEVEGMSASEAASARDQLARAFTQEGASSVQSATDPERAHALWSLRHAASPILSRLAPRLRSMQFIEDGCVPPAHFPAYIRGVREALRTAGMSGVIFGHAGDAHAHVNPLVDTQAAGWRDRVHQLLDEVCDLTARLGGTMAGEHGDGRLRAPLVARSWSLEACAVFAHIKAAGDPAGVLNPGCKVAAADALPFDQLRHDPEAPALPAEARAALDDIERRRDWGRFRLRDL